MLLRKYLDGKHNEELRSEGFTAPSTGEYKSINDAVMVPDKGFTKQLEALDKSLFVVWDWGQEKWQIWKWPDEHSRTQQPVHVLTVETKGKGYRELGADVLLKLQAGDTRKFSLKQICDYFDELDRQEQRRREKDFREKIRAIAGETFNYSRGVLQVQVPREYRYGGLVHV